MRDFMPRITRAAALAALVLAAACGGDGPSEPPEPPAPGSLSGAVRTTEGTGLSGVPISVRQGTSAPQTTRTDDAGAFRVEGLPAGAYVLTATLPSGYAPDSVRQEVRVNGGANTEVTLAAQPLRSLSDTIAPGQTDTLTLASGLSASVAVPAGGAPAVVTLGQVPAGTFGEFDPIAAPVSVEVRPVSGAARGASILSDGAAPVVTVWQRVATCTGATAEFAFETGRTADGKPLYLFGDPTCTTWTDPRTGQSGAAYTGGGPVPVGGTLRLALFRGATTCTGTERALTPVGAAADPSRTPVILIHGLQPFKTTCGSFASWDAAAATFPALTAALQANDSTSRAYQLYALRYPTFEPVANAVAFLRAEVERRGWQNRDIVLVGHSMGGLVGRGYLAAHGAQHVRALVTLGTPHAGSPFANEAAVRGAVEECVPEFLRDRAVRLFPRSAGVGDLDPAGAWIAALGGQRGGADRIYTFAGNGTLVPEWGAVGCVMDRVMGGAAHDGVVPAASALPDWTTFQTMVGGADHTQITAHSAPQVTRLLAQLSQCVPGETPAPPSVNGFPLAGTLSRQAGGRIDVVLNPIVVDGAPARGLAKGNFTVVENHCLKPFEITTSEGNLGVDLVFVQDLSGSMSSAITGVRNSVLQFATTLRDRGLNVRIGSVGFSGPGTITTHANQGSCERIGPVQDLASPETFRAHVAATWVATGGCDSPENALEAIEYAHRQLTWRNGATRVYVLITDVSVHTAATRCNALGACTDQTLESIVGLVGSTATIHVVAPSSATQRTTDGGLDPYLLAERTGGARLALSSTLNLNTLGIADRVADIVRLTFASGSGDPAHHRIRVRVEYGGKVAELSPGLVVYQVDPGLARAPRR